MVTNSFASDMIGKRYILYEEIGSGGMGIVYRATDRLTKQTVALKRVHRVPNDPDFESQANDQSDFLALANEFRTLASLRHPNIISVLDYGFDQVSQPYFTMEYLPEAKSILDAGKHASRQDHIQLIVKMLRALIYLHRRGILHRDLKPGNVLVTQGQVKLVDFGLSVMSKTPSIRHVTGTTAGTLNYMAPDLFQGAAISRASDLYAVGVIIYELFTGHPLFSTNNIAKLLNEIRTKRVDVWHIGLEDDLALVLERLLAKTETMRYTDAGIVIQDLCHAANVALPTETSVIRGSFMQSPKFVGRDTELAHLTESLNTALVGRGCTCLIGGESGVGKSRLLEELRNLALIKGALVVRGQAVSEGGSTYQAWRNVLRWLGIVSDLSNVEAGILKLQIPELGGMLDCDIQDVPLLDPQATQIRLFALINALFSRQKQPMMVILEDLQWADTESLALLQNLSEKVPQLPLFLIGSYRHDERPDLPQQIPRTQHFILSRLDDWAITELSGSVLGDSGRQPQVVEMLRRVTDGIAFFLVEVLRVLAEDDSELNRVGQTAQNLVGGVQQLIERRINRVPESVRVLLRLAAVMGRELDLTVLRAVDPAADWERWLSLCANATVLEVRENCWRFAHDKLREKILDGLIPIKRSDFHQQVAEAIEAVYGDAPMQTASLAYHWGMAGNADKERSYAATAGRQML